MGYLAGLGECPLAFGDLKGHCSWCGRVLVGRQKRWCSLHRDTWGINHYWTDARQAALIRDGYKCTYEGCDANGQAPPEALAWKALLRRICPPTLTLSAWAAREGIPDFGVGLDAAEINARFNAYVASAPWRLAVALWDQYVLDFRLEVDHIEPCLGKHATPGCWHHLAGLRTLCHRHHVIVTAEQFGREPAAKQLTLGT